MLIDANILLYAVVSDYPQHTIAKDWFEKQLNGPRQVAIPWPSLLAFIRISTNHKLFSQPFSVQQAWDYVDEWTGLSSVWIPQPLERHGEILKDLLLKTNASGNLVPDAHLAAIAIEHGLTVYSADRDFARFEQLKWGNPVAG